MADTDSKDLPPFYGALKKYVLSKKSLWSTPGHSGGEGMNHSAAGRDFKKFFGSNIFKADISSSVVEMGSILEHEGPSAKAEREAADTFGADITFFVLNGTSTANKVVYFATVSKDDVVLIGRNCHKSIMHAIIMNDAIPVYLTPKKNKYGLIGPISKSQFTKESIKAKIHSNPLITHKKARKVQLTSITNSTYDGLLYNADRLSSTLADLTNFMHFDEAWFPYGAFHTFYEKRYAMSPYRRRRGLHMPPVFATQSTHKLLMAFSQASMLHFRQGNAPVGSPDAAKSTLDIQGLVEANLMHASTSPFYPLFASLDVAARIMRESGYSLIDSAMDEALYFRLYMADKYRRFKKKGDWWFKVFQPDTRNLRKAAAEWILKPGDKWHGFEIEEGEDIMLDPLKVTLLTPGISEDGTLEDFGIPAVVLGKFLRSRNIIPEKTGFYNILFLFTPGVTRHKSMMLMRALAEFKRLYDANTPIFEVFPDLKQHYAEYYPEQAGLRDLCDQMHIFQHRHDILASIDTLYTTLPEQAVAPYTAYYKLVEGKTEYLRLDEIGGRISAFMILPYPPGIPLIMPGERFPAFAPDEPAAAEGPRDVSNIVQFLKMSELFDNIFRGFEMEFHGIKKIFEDGRPVYLINCLKETRRKP